MTMDVKLKIKLKDSLIGNETTVKLLSMTIDIRLSHI